VSDTAGTLYDTRSIGTDIVSPTAALALASNLQVRFLRCRVAT
jgi:hypothetical protein